MAVYDRFSRWLHGVLGFLITILLVIGFVMESMPFSALKWRLYYWHKLFGLIVLAGMVIRLGWRLRFPWLSYDNEILRWQAYLSRLVHSLLYILGILMPISGWVMSVAAQHAPKIFGWVLSLPIVPSRTLVSQANQTHFWLAWLLVGFISLHICGVIVHGFNEHGIIWRMWQKKRS